MKLKKGKNMFKKRYIAIFLMKVQNSFTIVVKKRFKPTVETLNYKKESYPIDISAYTFTNGITSFYCFDMKSKHQIFFEKSKKDDIDTKTINKILEQKIISQLTSDLSNQNFKTTLMNIIIGLLVGGLIGYIIGGII